MNDGLTVLTFNTGLLRVRLLGAVLLEVPHLDQRLPALRTALSQEPADVMCLQEVFRRRHRDLLVEALRGTHPHVVRADDRLRGLTHGLLIASRWPVTSASFTAFTARQWWQQCSLRQGWLSATVDVPGAGPTRFIDAHTTAGGRTGPETDSADRVRAAQVAQLRSAVDDAVPTLVCGDLNAGPQASSRNYRALLGDDWSDAADGTAAVTWEPDNLLNRTSRFADSPAQRIDHVLLNPAARARYAVRSARVVHDEPVVAVGARQVTLSDHYGLRVELVPSPARPVATGR